MRVYVAPLIQSVDCDSCVVQRLTEQVDSFRPGDNSRRPTFSYFMQKLFFGTSFDVEDNALFVGFWRCFELSCGYSWYVTPPVLPHPALIPWQ